MKYCAKCDCHETHRIRDNLLGFKGVNCNHRNVADQQESDNLTSGLRSVMFWQVNATSRHVGDEQQLQNHLQNCDWWCDGDKEVLIVFVCVQSASNDAKDWVQEEPKSWDAQQNVVEIALLFTTELQALNTENILSDKLSSQFTFQSSSLPTEANQDGKNGEDHQHAVTSVGQVISQDSELLVTNENEEQDQADQRSDQQQQSEEKSLRCAHAVDACSVCMCKGDLATRQHNFQSMFEILVGHFWIAPNVLPHDVNDDSANQRVLNDERIQIRRWVFHDRSHDVDAFTTCGVQVEWRDGWQARQILPSFSMRQIVELDNRLDVAVNVRSGIRSEVGDVSKLLSDSFDNVVEEIVWCWCRFVFRWIVVRKSGALRNQRPSGCRGCRCVSNRISNGIEARLEEASRWCRSMFGGGRWQAGCCGCGSRCRWQCGGECAGCRLDDTVQEVASGVFRGDS